MVGKRLLLIVSGGIAAYKSLDLLRRLRERGFQVRVILTKAGRNFVTPLSLAALSGQKVYEDLFSLTDETEMGHIRLSRDADLVVVAPASADLIAKMVAGLADDLASTALLATDKPVLIAPSMNGHMWAHAATQDNVRRLDARGIHFVGPEQGEMACGESGLGRMSEPDAIIAAIENLLVDNKRLAGRHAIVTSGPTREPLDPVRYLSNHSSGKQGHAIARALAALGARVTLVSGPVSIADPSGVEVRRVETADQMLEAVQNALPADILVCAAAIADWKATTISAGKIKKEQDSPPPPLMLTANPDILATLSHDPHTRPSLVVGFAAETDDVIAHAKAKLQRKGCDLIVANDVSAHTGTFGGDMNRVHLVDQSGVASWPALTKDEVARRLAQHIADSLDEKTQ